MRSAVESVIEAGASTFCIDYLSGKLRSVETEDTIDIGLDMVRQFISAGVLVQVGEIEFGEPEYAFQWCAISWTGGQTSPQVRRRYARTLTFRALCPTRSFH